MHGVFYSDMPMRFGPIIRYPNAVKNRVAHRWLGKPWFAALLLTAIFSRALIPVGFMPGPGGLILCSGYGAVPTMVAGAATAHDMSGMDMAGMDMSDHANHSGQGGHAPEHESMGICPYAAAASVLALNYASAVSALLQIVSTTIAYSPEKSVPRGTIVPTSLPRGPPSFLA
jgi:hypothetical protein